MGEKTNVLYCPSNPADECGTGCNRNRGTCASLGSFGNCSSITDGHVKGREHSTHRLSWRLGGRFNTKELATLACLNTAHNERRGAKRMRHVSKERMGVPKLYEACHLL